MIDFEKLFIEDTFHIDWDYVESIKEFNDLKNAQQNPVWHSEGNAFIHTRCVVECMENIIGEYPYLENSRKRILMAAAVLHDIGKGQCTFQKDGKWHSYGHEDVGAKMVENLLSNCEDGTKKDIISLVKNHMKPLNVMKRKKPVFKLKEMSKEVNLFNLFYLKLADIQGSDIIDKDAKKKDIETMYDMLEIIKSILTIK